MAKILYAGGPVNTSGCYNSPRVGFSTKDEISYAGHTPTRNWILEFHYDSASSRWIGYHDREGAFANGDELSVFALSEGTVVNSIVVHNGKASGVVDDVTGDLETSASLGVSIVTNGTALRTLNVDLGATGYTAFQDTRDDPSLLATNSTVDVKLDGFGGVVDACFTIFVELSDFRPVLGCECARNTCGAEYPEANC